MQISRRGVTLLSQLTIDTDLNMGAHSLKTDTIEESTAAAGVTIEGLLIKDSHIHYEWNVTAAVWSKLFDVATEESGPTGLFFKPDGTKMYIVGTVGDEVNEYNLVTPWDVSSAVWVQLFDISTKESFISGVFFKYDGTKMYIVGSGSVGVNEYDLSTPWDISSAVWLQLFSVASEETAPQGLFFKPDGTKVYIIGSAGRDVNEYNLYTAWDISSAIWSQLFSVASEETFPTALFFKPDGTQMYIIGQTGDEVEGYALSAPWDISSAVWSQLFSVATEEIAPTGLFFKPDGAKMYIVGTDGDNVDEYDL